MSHKEDVERRGGGGEKRRDETEQMGLAQMVLGSGEGIN